MNEPINIELIGCPDEDMLECVFTELRRIRSNGYGLPDSECDTSFRAFDVNKNIVPRSGYLSQVVRIQVHSRTGILMSVYSCSLKDGNVILKQWAT